MQNDVLIEFLKKRKDRSIAILLSFKDDLDRRGMLDAGTSQKMRKLILDQVNDVYNCAIDLIDTLDTGDVVVNEEYLKRLQEKMDAIYDKVVADAHST